MQISHLRWRFTAVCHQRSQLHTTSHQPPSKCSRDFAETRWTQCSNIWCAVLLTCGQFFYRIALKSQLALVFNLPLRSMTSPHPHLHIDLHWPDTPTSIAATYHRLAGEKSHQKRVQWRTLLQGNYHSLQDLCIEARSSGVKWDSQHVWPWDTSTASVGTDLLPAHGPARLCHRAEGFWVYQSAGEGDWAEFWKEYSFSRHMYGHNIMLQRMVSGLPDWMRLWCVMRQSRLRCWKNPEDVGRRMPEHVIELTEVLYISQRTTHWTVALLSLTFICVLPI